ncbi:MAG: hypothetical protein LAT82_01270 [Nanoarchaeota archaeon]|nr:hypothetical protein [Nanoarchaeota archaeon]
MKLLKAQENSNFYLIEHFDDIWVLSKYILKDDIVCSKSTRKVAIGDDKTKQVTKVIYVELRVKKVEFEHLELRIQGTIENETEFTTKGSHHSLQYSIGDTIEIKESNVSFQRPNFLKKLLHSALNSMKNKFLIILCDVDSLIVARASLFSIDVLFEKSRLGSKKFFSTHKQTTNLEEMINSLDDVSFQEYNFVIFAGVGTYKNQLKVLCEKKYPSFKSVVIDTLDCEVSTVSKIVDELKHKNIIDDVSEQRASEKIELFLKSLATDNKVAYGVENIVDLISQGVVKEIILTSSFYNEFLENYFSSIEILEQMGGEITIISSNSHHGSIVQGMGGVVALLRY